MNDKELRDLLRSSPRDGQRAVFEQYAGYVYTIVWSKLRGCGTREDAEECVSDVFAEVLRSYDPAVSGSLQGYIGTVAKRRAINAYHHLTGGTQMLPLEEAAALPDGSDVAENAELSQMRRILLDKIAALGEPDASIVTARYFFDRTAPEIARMTGLSPAAVRMRLSRAVRVLRKSLEEAGFGN